MLRDTESVLSQLTGGEGMHAALYHVNNAFGHIGKYTFIGTGDERESSFACTDKAVRCPNGY